MGAFTTWNFSTVHLIGAAVVAVVAVTAVVAAWRWLNRPPAGYSRREWDDLCRRQEANWDREGRR
jgi:hypothetical protein